MVDNYITVCILLIMIYENPTTDSQFEKVIGAFSSATRRKIILQLFEEDMTVNAIAEKNNITKQAASKQKNILAESGIITQRKSGRQVYCSINPQVLTTIKDYVRQLESFWDKRLHKLKDLIEE